jgi:hypothetical protein
MRSRGRCDSRTDRVSEIQHSRRSMTAPRHRIAIVRRPPTGCTARYDLARIFARPARPDRDRPAERRVAPAPDRPARTREVPGGPGVEAGSTVSLVMQTPRWRKDLPSGLGASAARSTGDRAERSRSRLARQRSRGTALAGHG